MGNLFSDEEGKIKWSYTGDTGPEAWGQIAKEYELCGVGKVQSPVDIATKEAVYRKFSTIKFYYQPLPIDIINTGHTIKVKSDKKSYIDVGGKIFRLHEFHFHLPSEHTINGKYYPMDVHFVHKSDDGEFAVLGVFFEQGNNAHPELEKIFNAMPEERGRKVKQEGILVDISKFFPANDTFYFYDGSFTMPPCSEVVEWYVFEKPISISKDQIEQFRKLYPGNSRPTQPLHQRSVYKNKP